MPFMSLLWMRDKKNSKLIRWNVFVYSSPNGRENQRQTNDPVTLSAQKLALGMMMNVPCQGREDVSNENVSPVTRGSTWFNGFLAFLVT